MKKILASAIILTSLSVNATPAVIDTTGISPRLYEWFGSYLEGKAPSAFVPDLIFKQPQTAEMTRMVWDAWCTANKAFDEEKLPELTPLSPDSASWQIPEYLEPNAVMTFRYGSKGAKPAAGYPLYLYIHGSGEPSREWANGLRFGEIFEDSPSVYFIPRIPNTGEWYRWYQRGKQFAWERLLRQGFVSGKIDPNKVYFFGISEGGYGSQRLASFYADYLAGAGPMAGGEPLRNAPAENCRNIAFSLRTGDQDFGFYRDKLTRSTLAAFDSLQAANPEDFKHWVELIPGKGHAIDYTPTTPWLRQSTRNPWPKRVSWENFEMDGRKRNAFYNLSVLEPDSLNCRTRYEMSIERNTVTLTVDRVEYVTTETDPRWGIEMAFYRKYTPAKEGMVTIYFNNHLVDLNKPVTVIINGVKAFKGKLPLTLDNLVESCALFYDPERLFPASITLPVK